MSAPQLSWSGAERQWIDPYLPSSLLPQATAATPDRPYLTLTYASSLDAALTGIPGQQTWISGPESTSMTHYLRSTHDAILIGVGTAIAANPSLNCRLQDTGSDPHPRPVIIDPTGRWTLDENRCNVLRAAKTQQGKGPWIVTATRPSADQESLLTRLGGEYIVLPTTGGQIEWSLILKTLCEKGIKSVMVEGGAHVINTLLAPMHKQLVDAVVITIAPCWLGTGSVTASPSRQGVSPGNTLAQLQNVSWNQLGEDVVLCANVSHS